MTPLDVIAAVFAVLVAASVVGLRAIARRRRSRRRRSVRDHVDRSGTRTHHAKETKTR